MSLQEARGGPNKLFSMTSWRGEGVAISSSTHNPHPSGPTVALDTDVRTDAAQKLTVGNYRETTAAGHGTATH